MDLAGMKTDQARANQQTLVDELERIESMINSPEMREMRNRRRETDAYIRPRNASTMILLDNTSGKTKVLMGKRNRKLKFMPGALVFPGGSVDRFDGSVPASGELTTNTACRLQNAMRGRSTSRGARALGMAAIREVSEESGLLIGNPGKFDNDHTHWKDFRDCGIVPNLSGLRLFARAITPPGLARRFDTWFFIAEASQVGFTPSGGFAPDGELEALQWIEPEKAIQENTREITRVMLVELVRRLREDPGLSDTHPAPYYHVVGQRFRKTMI